MLRRAPATTVRKLTPLVRRRLQNQGLDEHKNAWMIPNVGRELASIRHEALEPCGEHVTSASGFDLLCSYSWKEKAKGSQPGRSGPPQIYVPGETTQALVFSLY